MRLRLATFNLESLDARPNKPAAIDERIAILRPQLLRLDADVLCLQEVSAFGKHPRPLTALGRLLADTPYAHYGRVVSTGPHGSGPADVHNLVTLSRWPAPDHRQIRHDLVPIVRYIPVTSCDHPAVAIDNQFDRPILYAKVPLPTGRVLHVINVHLRSPLASPIPGQKQSAFVWRSVAGWAEGFFVATLKRAGQALEARLFLETIFDADPEASVVVCGDFNAEAREVPVRTILGDVDETANPALAVRSLVAAETAVDEGRRFTVRHAGHALMLDHVLVSRALLPWVSRVEIHNEALRDEVLDAQPVRPPVGSFHAPVAVEFVIPDDDRTLVQA